MLKQNQKIYVLLAIGVMYSILAFQACKKPETLTESDFNEWYSGGAQTVFVSGSGAYSNAFPKLTAEKEELHGIGDAGFEAVFNSDPNQLNYGLGPVYNNVSCASCHVGDGRGKAPETGEALTSLLIRISIPGLGGHGSPNPVPGFGGQLQQKGILGAPPEANVDVVYTEQTFAFADGESYTLRKPVYSLSSPYATLPGNVLLSPRMASPVFGLGLLEAVSEADIIALADENDANGDGISGKPNSVWSVEKQTHTLGRFGWKAGQPTVIQQSAGAYNEDMGVTSFIFPTESTYGQPQHGISMGRKEVSDSLLYAVAYYVRTLAVPGRRKADNPEVQLGKNLFRQVGCNNCHNPVFTTQTNVAASEFSNQTIFPYTDMLLHDMGEGLADNRPEFEANGYEWRTAPLWGIGLTKAVNGHNNFLHDGRARNFTEAIMWHGGEAEASKTQYAKLNKADRDAVIKFLGSL